MVWYGVVRHGMVWYGIAWHGMAWYGMVWYGVVGHGMVQCSARHCIVWYGMEWYGMVWYGMVWYDMVWYGVVWYGMVWYGMTHVCVCKDEAGVRGSDLAALHLQRCCRRPLVRGGRSAAAAAVCLEFLQGKAYGRGEWGMLGWRADETREHGVAGERVDARGWYIRQAGAGDGGCWRVRSMSGVCVCASLTGRGGGVHTFSQDWSQSLPRNMRGPGEGKGRRGESLPRLSHSTIAHPIVALHQVPEPKA